MVCNVCGVNKATVHVTEFVNNQVVEVHMCDTCAAEKDQSSLGSLSLTDILSGLIQFTTPTTQDEKAPLKTKCPGCRLSIEDIKKTGKVGCAGCYETFEHFLMPLISKVQGAKHHIGKKNIKGSQKQNKQDYSLRMKLEELEAVLKKQVENEQYEEAATTRDSIKKIRADLEGVGKKKATRKKVARKKSG